MTRDVILAPGLWNPGVALALLAARLKRAGYRPRIFTYRGRSSFEANVERLAQFAGSAPAHYVGHSLGGVLILAALSRHAELAASSAILLGAPVRGCLAGRRFSRHSAGRWMMGGCGALWEEREARWTRPAPLGVIAGTLPLGLGRAFGRLPSENDGVVCLSETAVDGMSERVLVPVGHSLLVVSGQVGRLVEHFLRTGAFA